MNKTETAQQLRLAADLIETGHPFEFHDGGEWVKAITITPDHAICERRQVRPILATPPDGRPLHNPDGLTAEQVGLGRRLTIKGEKPTSGAQIWMGEDHINGEWEKRDVETDPYYAGTTYRLPLSVPWPEAPKPEATTKTVPLGPDDVPPCSVVSGVESRWLSITCCHKDGVYVQNSEDNLNLLTWSELLRDGVKINRSIPFTGKWDANAWEPCSKEVQA